LHAIFSDLSSSGKGAAVLSIIRRRLTYANVAATLALMFSMGSGALAATHYLISSKKQISPKVLKELKGNVGAKGASGATGAQGAAGTPGAAGATGAPGSAVAYASVVVNGAGNVSFLNNVGFTSVSEPQSGTYCLVPAYPGHPILATPAGTFTPVAVQGASQCPGGYELRAEGLTSGQGFTVTVP
jgi:hypothetical protein